MTTPTPDAIAPSSTRPGRCACCGAALKLVKGDRRFTLLDAMILVAASAVAFLLARSVFNNWYVKRLPNWGEILAIVIAILTTWTPTVLFLKLRSPRPTLRRLSKQPDFVATLAATSILCLEALGLAILWLVRIARRGVWAKQGRPIRTPTLDSYWWIEVVIMFTGAIGAAVLASWVVLVVSGRHRASWGWLDLLGRTLGGLWVALFIINCCARLAQLRD